MSKIDDSLAEDFVPEFEDVSVILNTDLAKERDRLQAALIAAKSVTDLRLGQADPVAEAQAELDSLADKVAEHQHIIRVRALEGFEWTLITDRHPARKGVALDQHYGYNLTSATAAALIQAGSIIEDDAEVEITPERWARITPRLSGWDAQKLVDVVFRLHVYDAQQREDALEKHFGATASS
ncbi:hypothetical protein D9V32_05540 [Mycetocola tolaasinivorans]|uniref:Tail assembly chaperone n=1 Tax=Mycetocola tolaasinivorans TaxID=76635 RepID=A0A3L7A7R1_9MICO|nr:hypothetical protein [Mycetocola tolaasinivorans]RLP76333.1 hypothetical protein D9V32_05540 [Mycetocola tolaasinivorans]